MDNYIAQTINNPAVGKLGSLNGSQFLGRLIPALLGVGLTIGAVVFLFVLIIGAVEWITSGGDKVRYESARDKITKGLIGIFILFCFFVILNLVECFFGIGLRQIAVGELSIGFKGSPFCPAN